MLHFSKIFHRGCMDYPLSSYTTANQNQISLKKLTCLSNVFSARFFQRLFISLSGPWTSSLVSSVHLFNSLLPCWFTASRSRFLLSCSRRKFCGQKKKLTNILFSMLSIITYSFFFFNPVINSVKPYKFLWFTNCNLACFELWGKSTSYIIDKITWLLLWLYQILFYLFR